MDPLHPAYSTYRTSEVMLFCLLTCVDIKSLLIADKLSILSRKKKTQIQNKKSDISANGDVSEMKVLLSSSGRDNQGERCYVDEVYSLLRYSPK